MTHSDEELVRRFRGGDESAFEALVARWYAPLLQLAWRLTGQREEAEEIRQMALIQTYRAADRFEERSRFSTWIYRVCLNLARDRHRRKHVRLRAVDSLADEAAPDVEAHTPLASFERQERVERVAEAVLALPSEIREVVVLRSYHDLSFPAIAEIIGAPVTTVKSRMQRGLDKLRSRLQPLGPQDSPQEASNCAPVREATP